MDTSRSDDSLADTQRAALAFVQWHGTTRQGRQLLGVILGNCTCGAQGPLCVAHSLVTDQRTLDGLIFGQYLADRLRVEEFAVRT